MVSDARKAILSKKDLEKLFFEFNLSGLDEWHQNLLKNA